MIFTKAVSFPYPVLTNSSNAYINNSFEFTVDLQENVWDYHFQIDYRLESDYLNRLIKLNKATLLFIVQSKDNKFYSINDRQVVSIPKNRISLSKRTTLQLIVRAEEGVEFSENNDLASMYNDIKEEIRIPKHGVLALSNVEIFDGSIRKPFDLFEKKLQPYIKADIQIELGTETIIICYQNENLQFITSPHSRELNYPYIYMGLQKALMKMIDDIADGEDALYIDEMALPESGLNVKLFNLLKAKKVEKLNYDNIDEVIFLISDRIIERYCQTIKRIQDNGN